MTIPSTPRKRSAGDGISVKHAHKIAAATQNARTTTAATAAEEDCPLRRIRQPPPKSISSACRQTRTIITQKTHSLRPATGPNPSARNSVSQTAPRGIRRTAVTTEAKQHIMTSPGSTTSGSRPKRAMLAVARVGLGEWNAEQAHHANPWRSSVWKRSAPDVPMPRPSAAPPNMSG